MDEDVQGGIAPEWNYRERRSGVIVGSMGRTRLAPGESCDLRLDSLLARGRKGLVRRTDRGPAVPADTDQSLRPRIDPRRLPAVTSALVGMSGFEDLTQQQAAAQSPLLAIDVHASVGSANPRARNERQNGDRRGHQSGNSDRHGFFPETARWSRFAVSLCIMVGDRSIVGKPDAKLSCLPIPRLRTVREPCRTEVLTGQSRVADTSVKHQVAGTGPETGSTPSQAMTSTPGAMKKKTRLIKKPCSIRSKVEGIASPGEGGDGNQSGYGSRIVGSRSG